MAKLKASDVTALAIALIQAGLDLQRMEQMRVEVGRDGYTDDELAMFRDAARVALQGLGKALDAA